MKVTALICERERPASIGDTVFAIVKDNPELPNNTLVHLCVAAGCNPATARSLVADFKDLVRQGRTELRHWSVVE